MTLHRGRRGQSNPLLGIFGVAVLVTMLITGCSDSSEDIGMVNACDRTVEAFVYVGVFKVSWVAVAPGRAVHVDFVTSGDLPYDLSVKGQNEVEVIIGDEDLSAADSDDWNREYTLTPADCALLW